MGTRRASWPALFLVAGMLLLRPDSGSAQPARAAANGHPRGTGQESGSPWDRTQILARIYLGEFTPGGLPNLIDVKWLSPSSPKRGICEIDFISHWPTSPKLLLSYPEGYSFIGADIADDGMLMTEWSAADTAVLQVFHLVKGGAKLVLEKSRMGTVEYWHSTVLVTESAKGPDGEYRYTTTGFWQWNGRQYKLVATVPYGQRLEALAKLGHGAKKK